MTSEKMIETQNEYEKRIIAFADILGWRNAIKDSECESLKDIVTSIEDYANKFSPQLKDIIEGTDGICSTLVKEYSGIEFSFFSDSFVVSAPIDYAKNVFKILAFANDILLRKKLLVRGSVTIGDLCHRQRRIFGPALVEAVEMEENEVMYPRFLCSDKLVAHLDNKGYKDEVVLEDFPQSWVVNIACGSPIACDELMAIVRSELALDKSERIMRKWRYTQEMLPIMYKSRSIIN